MQIRDIEDQVNTSWPKDWSAETVLQQTLLHSHQAEMLDLELKNSQGEPFTIKVVPVGNLIRLMKAVEATRQ